MPVFEPAFDIEYDIGTYPPAFEDEQNPPTPSVEYITNFISSRSSYAKLSSQVSVSTAYKIRADVEFKTGVINAPILGLEAGSSDYFRINTDGTIRLQVDFGKAVETTLAITRDDVVHEVSIELSGNDFIFTVDGSHFETVTNATVAADPFSFDSIATRNAVGFFDGFIRNMHVEESSVVVASLPMNEPFSEPDFANETDPLNPATKVNISADQVIEI